MTTSKKTSRKSSSPPAAASSGVVIYSRTLAASNVETSWECDVLIPAVPR